MKFIKCLLIFLVVAAVIFFGKLQIHPTSLLFFTELEWCVMLIQAE